MIEFLGYVALGFAVTAIPGAVFFETLRRLLISTSSAYWFLAGNFSGMALIIASSYIGLPSIMHNQTVALVFYLTSAMLLIYLGVTALASKEMPKSEAGTYQKNLQSGTSYLVGFTLSIANPLSIAFWVSLSGQLLSTYSNVVAWLYSLAIMLGAALVFSIMIFSSATIRKLKASHLVIVSKISGLVILYFGVMTLRTAISIL